MLSLTLPGRVFVCTLPTDMRKSFDTLAALVQSQLSQGPLPTRKRKEPPFFPIFPEPFGRPCSSYRYEHGRFYSLSHY